MNDQTKRLLELAAKAIGLRLVNWRDDWESFGPGWRFERDDGICDVWNPASYNGDALRLAVKLGMLVEVDWEARSVTVVLPATVPCAKIVNKVPFAEGSDGMPETRLAIVRAAASVGEAL